MAVPTLISELSTTAALNSPDGAIDTPSSLDNYQRAHASFIAQLRDRTASNWPNTPAGNLAATTVQAALNELDTEKAKAGANSDISSLSAITSINGGQLAGMRNRIINGDMRIDQRNSGAWVAVASNLRTFGVDRTTTYANAISTCGRTEGHVTGSSALTLNSAAGMTIARFGQKVEAANSYDLAGKLVTISCWAIQSTGNILNTAIVGDQCIATDDYATSSNLGPFSCTPSTIQSGVWTKLTATFTVPVAATLGIEPAFYFTGGINAGVIAVTELQLELGSVATPFEQRPIGLELALCQRYYSIFEGQQTGYVWQANGSDGMRITYSFPVNMRSTPTQTLTGVNYGGTSSLVAVATLSNTNFCINLKSTGANTNVYATGIVITSSAEL